MNSFTVTHQQKTYHVELHANRRFSIFRSNEKLGEIYPVPGTLTLHWESSSGMAEDLVSRLGGLIEMHQIGEGVL